MSDVNLVLIGMPATGKSTLGKELAKALELQFIDTDEEIERLAGKPKQLILDQGIDVFSEYEKQALVGLRRAGLVVATGGSAIYCQQALENIKQYSVILHLTASLPSLEKRIKDFDTRAVVMPNKMSFTELYDQRMPLYRQIADVEMKTDQEHESMQDYIVRAIQLYKKALVNK